MSEAEQAGANVNWGIVVLRVIMGAIFLAGGLQRLMHLDLRPGLEFLESTGSYSQTYMGALVMLTGCVAGTALILGLLTRWSAALLMLDVVLGIWSVDVSAATFLPSGGRFALILLGGLTALLWAGSGGFALDALHRRGPGAVGDGIDVAVRLEERRGKKLARCVVTVRDRGGNSNAPAARAEVWHGRMSA